MSEGDTFDFIIVGAGMIGSSTAKYVSKLCQGKVGIVGVEEGDKNIFGAWHDEARITR